LGARAVAVAVQRIKSNDVAVAGWVRQATLSWRVNRARKNRQPLLSFPEHAQSLLYQHVVESEQGMFVFGFLDIFSSTNFSMQSF
jgi:hypothetical protein